MEPTHTASTEADVALAASLQRGESQALESLYDRYGRLVFGLANRMIPDRAAAEDVVQEAFLSAWRNASSFDPSRGSLRSWLLSIVHNRAIDRLRTSRRRLADAALEMVDAQVHDADPYSAVAGDADRQAVREALASLPAEQRQTLELAYFGGLTHVEIALRMGVPLGTVKGRMRLGLEKLRSSLQASGIEP